jgi:heme-degrading monooxygenase HmoA
MHAMAHLRMTIATWDLDLDGAEGQALIERIARDGAAVFRAQPGFVRYRLMRAGPRRTVAMAEWASEELALAGATRFREWLAAAGIRQHIDMETDSGPILVAADADAASGS